MIGKGVSINKHRNAMLKYPSSNCKLGNIRSYAMEIAVVSLPPSLSLLLLLLLLIAESVEVDGGMTLMNDESF